MQNDKTYVFVGLGNPGKEYELTRHNLGFLVLKTLANEEGMKFKEEPRFQACVARGQVEGKTVVLLLPMTYMNESGRAVKALWDYYKFSLGDLLVVVDDVALQYGMMRIRPQGSAGGHKGLKSLEAFLGTVHYARLRMGIGEQQADASLAEHVLDRFTEEELKSLPDFLKRATSVLRQLLTKGLVGAMNSVNANLKNKLPETRVGECGHDTT